MKHTTAAAAAAAAVAAAATAAGAAGAAGAVGGRERGRRQYPHSTRLPIRRMCGKVRRDLSDAIDPLRRGTLPSRVAGYGIYLSIFLRYLYRLRSLDQPVWSTRVWPYLGSVWPCDAFILFLGIGSQPQPKPINAHVLVVVGVGRRVWSVGACPDPLPRYCFLILLKISWAP